MTTEILGLLLGQYKTDLITLQLALRDVATLATRLAQLDPTEIPASKMRSAFADEAGQDVAARLKGVEALIDCLAAAEAAGQQIAERLAAIGQG